MNMEIDYDLIAAHSLAKFYKRLTGINYKTARRTPRDAYFRALFYKVLMDLNDMNDRMISEYCEKFLGRSRNRSSICTAVSKVDSYYLNYKDFRNAYDFFFDDKFKEQRKREVSQMRNSLKRKKEEERIRDIKLSKMVSFTDSKKIELNNMIAELSDEKVIEITELVSLRIKSWEWKAKNEYQIIDCQE